MQQRPEQPLQHSALAEVQVYLPVDGVEDGNDILLLVYGGKRKQNRTELARIDVSLSDGAARELLDLTSAFSASS